ncbi:MAG TPA: adenylate/guanylate cyclase domain-containing protein [Nitrososphaeraceae archaeon]|nr:adenylate/guanylate cyclase domain-containing protein [Nitrososphaeraceae archaeon]
MYNSGIMPDIIALELDISQEEVMRIIQKENSEERRKMVIKNASNIPLLTKFHFDELVSINKAIQLAQSRMWRALKVGSEFNISMDETQHILEIYAKSKLTLVILHVDLVESTRLLMTLPVDRLATIIQAFSQEMSLIIAAYGGYVLKYVGDAILAFFVVDYRDLYLPSINAVNCACAMIKVIREGLNPILNQYDYPELNVRIGIDLGENAVVQYGWETHTIDGKVVSKKPQLDILGYTMSIATKMTALAKPDQIIIGQLVYDVLDDKQKSTFKLLPISPLIWNYSSSNTGNIYHLYVSITENENY